MSRNFRVRTEVGKEKKLTFELKQDFDLLEIFTLLTATVTISAPDIFMAFAHSDIFLYLPVPTINLEENFFFPTIN